MSAPHPDPSGAGESPARPQYGEHATPEQQRARIQEPQEPFAAPAAPAGPAASVPPAPLPGPAWGPPAPTAARRHPVDRIATIILLAYGAVNVVLSAVSFTDLPAVAQQTYAILGIQADFTNVASARVWGAIAAVVLAVGYVVTLVLALRSLRRGRLTWWIPLVGAAATFLLVYVCIAIPLLSDPAFLQYATNPR